MNLRLVIDGTDVPASLREPLDGVQITRRQRDGTGGAAPSFSTGIRVYGTLAEDLLRRLVTDRTDDAIPVELYDDCCDPPDLLIAGEIKADGISWCEGCDYLEIEITERSALNCLEYTYLFESDIVSQQNPFVRYCVELRPSFVHDVLIALTFLSMVGLAPVLLVSILIITTVNIAITTINAIIDAVNTLPGVDIAKINTIGDSILGFDLVFDLLRQLGDAVVGCRRGHTAYYIHDLVNRACATCNITFQSSIWNDPLAQPDMYYTVLLPRSVRKGFDDYNNWAEQNKPLKTIAAFLDELATATNASWWIEGSAVRLETKATRLASQPPTAIDPNDDDVLKVCYEFDEDGVPAVIEIEPTLDGIDWVGNEAKRLYQELITYNNPVNLRLRGIREVRMPYAPARFRDDGIERDVQTFWASFLGGPISQFMVSLPVIGSFFDTFLGPFVDLNGVYSGALLLPTDTADQDKWLTIDQGSQYTNAKVVRVPRGGGNWHYNWPMWVDSGASDYPSGKPNLQPNMYQFFAPDDPRINPRLGIRFDAELYNSCELRNLLRPGLAVALPIGNGLIDEVIISTETLRIRGTL